MFLTGLTRYGYRRIAKPLFFRRDPEKAHDSVVAMGKLLGGTSITRGITRVFFNYENPILAQEILGIQFTNPVGLTAGFDKNAELIGIMPSVGFGFHEIGSVTGEPCEGNPKPRLWRMPKTGALIVWYGLKNDGCEVIAERIEERRMHIPVGTNIAKTNCKETVDTDAGIRDYEKAFRALADVGHYFVVNVSCPNTYGGEPFTTPDRLERLLTRLDAISTSKPVLLKLGADLTPDGLDALVHVTDRHRIHGFILSNLTKQKNLPSIRQDELVITDKGGVSGKPVAPLSNALISHLYRSVGDRYVIIGTGGIFTAEDAYEKIKNGASLVQLATGMIFQGPQSIGEINRGIAQMLHEDGYHNISEAIGSAHKK